MIVLLGDSGKFPDTASAAEGLTYFVLLLVVGGLTTVPMVWTIIWIALLFNGIEIGWGNGLLICCQLGVAALVVYIIYYIATEVYKTIKRRQNAKT